MEPSSASAFVSAASSSSSTPASSLPTPVLALNLEPMQELESGARGCNFNPDPDGFRGGGEEVEEPTPLQWLAPLTEEALFSQYYSVARSFLSSFDGKLPHCPGADIGEILTTHFDHHLLSGDPRAIVPVATYPSVSNAVVADKKKSVRSSDMVRVSVMDAREQRHVRDQVSSTRITYESLRALMLWGEEKGKNRPGLSRKSCRADLKAAALMKERGLWLNRDKRMIGNIPGVTVGDVFFFRMELCVIGLHGQVQAGIDYVPAASSSSREPIATSIILSGGYEDDQDSGDMIIYTGQGGRERKQQRQSIHQKLEGGNLALERSMHYGVEIRVIRRLKSDRSPNGNVYVYDGLYRIVNCWLDVGKSGFGVYKYKLLRNGDQCAMGSATFKLAGELKRNLPHTRPAGYLSRDISMGKERRPVSLFNDIDDNRDPMLFEYRVNPVYPPQLALQQMASGGAGSGCGCVCVSNCTTDCFCADKNGGEFAYDENMVLLRGKPLIYECGRSCRCPPSCPNRVTQRGIQNKLEVFRSRETGWGVRSLDLIRAGTFICEFAGIVLTKQQSEVLSMNGDNLAYPGRFPGRWAEWGDISSVFQEYAPPIFPTLPPLNFSLDVSRLRNVACYLSHSCSPNVFVQFVLHDHYNVSYPHLMIFAMENIPPMRELSLDYGVGDTLVKNKC